MSSIEKLPNGLNMVYASKPVLINANIVMLRRLLAAISFIPRIGIIPRSRGGSDDLSNLALCCAPCNLHKSNNIEKEGARFFHPRQDSWEDYFTWNDDYTIVIGKTKIGQITIEALQMK